MGSIGDPFTTSVPAVGSAGPQFATDIDAILNEVITRLSAKVPLTSVAAGTLNMVGNPITNAGYITFTNSLTVPGASPVNRVTSYNGDLYYVSPSGVIQLTSGAVLNAASIGGITGDYTGVGPMQFRYTIATSRYDAYFNFSTSTFGYVRALGFDVAAGPTSSFFARILFTGAANKTYTLPAAAASSGTRPLYIDSTGNITVGYNTNKSYSFSAASSLNTGTPDVATFLTNGALKNGTNAASCVMSMSGVPQDFLIASATCHLTNKSASNSATFNFVKVLNGTRTVLATGAITATGVVNQVFTLGVAETVDNAAKYYAELVYSVANVELLAGFSVTGTFPT